MSWKSISKISRNSAPQDPQQKETKAAAEFILQAAGIKAQEPKAEPQPQAKEANKEDQGREGQMAALKQQYVEGKPFDDIIAESGIPRATLFRWRKDQNWDEEKNKKAILAQKLVETLAFYEDPKNTEGALAERNLQLLLKIQGINLAKLMHKAISGEAPDVIALMMSDSLNKYSGMLEKLIKSDQSIKSGGVERKEVVHIQALDMDDAVRLALEMKKKGTVITVQEAMALLTAQQSKKSEVK